MIGWATGLGRRHARELQRLQIQRIDEGLDCPNRVVCRHIIIERCWQQIVLPAVFPFDETAHPKASRNAREPYQIPAILRSLGRQPSVPNFASWWKVACRS
jgi:hypothetical protein